MNFISKFAGSTFNWSMILLSEKKNNFGIKKIMTIETCINISITIADNYMRMHRWRKK